MAKTEIEIERDFYHLVKDSTLGQSIRGKVYRRGKRPDNSKQEDIIAGKHLSGLDEQIQNGIVIINVYVPYISEDSGRMVEDLNRIEELQSLANGLITDYEGTDYYLTKDGTPKSYPQPDLEQTIIAIRIKYQRLNQE